MDNHDLISLAIGDGGMLTKRFIQEEIIPRFENEILNEMNDAGVCLNMTNGIVVTTDSFIVDPPIFSGGDIGKLAVTGTVNDLVATGAHPIYLTLSIIMLEGTRLQLVQRILDSIQATARQCDIKVIAGDTKVLPRQSGNVSIILNTTGIGSPINPKNNYSTKNVQNGDFILTTGSIASHALAVLSAREGLGFCDRVTSDCAPLAELIIPLIKRFDGIHSMRDSTRGGVCGVLFDMVDDSHVDIVLDRSSIPIQKEVLFGCEMLGLDPLNLANEGNMIITVVKEQVSSILDFLHSNELGTDAAIIGNVINARDPNGRMIINENGTELIFTRPHNTGIPRLC